MCLTLFPSVKLLNLVVPLSFFWFSALFFPVSAGFICKEMKAKTERDESKEWMFFPLCFLAPSLFSCVLLFRCTAGGEESYWRRKRRDKGDDEGVLVGPPVFPSVYLLASINKK